MAHSPSAADGPGNPEPDREECHVVVDADRGNSWKYLYGRLGNQRFQQLCSALLVNEFPGGGVRCFPVGQRDGGRDTVRQHNGRKVIYQVKWSNSSMRSPVGWLESAIKKESENIKQLVTAGADEYILLTSIAGTADRDRGTIDRLDKILEGHSKDFGIQMTCWWQSDIDARVDLAPRDLKWTYSDMLVGNDLIRYLVEADQVESRDRELRDLILKVVATQRQEDARVKFKRVELDVYNLSDLFVDVEAQRVAQARRAEAISRPRVSAERVALGGAAKYLLSTKQPLTLIVGEPGQGKSTLGQYVCQVHRDELLGNGHADEDDSPAAIPMIRVPLRIDLRDYASWLAGTDPFDEDQTSKSRKKDQARKNGTIEQFLSPFIETRSGGLKCPTPLVHDILKRFPMLIVLDGLDEVAQSALRDRVVAEIDTFSARLGASSTAPQIVVTTRPNASRLAEPSKDIFETVVLSRLSTELRTAYLRKWSDANGVRGGARRALSKTFRERSAEPHIALLADNPMQLTILLYLIHKRGDSVPTDRTELYTSYMETLLDREGEKTRAVIDHRPDLEEVTAYLGWYLQSLAEAKGGNGQLPTKALRKAILDYLFEVEKKTELVDALFTAVTDRVWALTSKVQGTFEFDVQPVREYFAAKFLHDFAGADQTNFDSSEVLRELVQRAYWLNTTRFYVGFANPNELAGLVSGLADEFEKSNRPRQVRVATWTLLADGVFAGRTRAQKDAAKLLTDDLSLVLLSDALSSDPDMSVPVLDRGGKHLLEALQEDIVANPTSPMTTERLNIVTKLVADKTTFVEWWKPLTLSASGSQTEITWLDVGATFGAASSLGPGELEQIAANTPNAARSLVAAGSAPQSGSTLENTLVRAELNGWCSEANPNTAGGYAGDLLRILAPAVLLRKATETAQPFQVRTGHQETLIPDSQRSSALTRLKARDPRFEKVQAALRFNRGEKNSTFPWSSTARQLTAIVGPCWLAAEIAVIGAATSSKAFGTATSQSRNALPLGDTPDYGLLLQELRKNRSNAQWWDATYSQYPDALSHATWALALLTIASEEILVERLPTLDLILEKLTPEATRALIESSSRIGAAGIARRIAHAAVPGSLRNSLTLSVILTHHSTDLNQLDTLANIDVSVLTAMSQFGVAGWAALRALTARALEHPSEGALAGLRAYGPTALVEVPIPSAHIDELAAEILIRPALYPTSWVLAVEQALSRTADESNLLDVATSLGWFSS